ncbi:RNase J family beta-CASP ribonuclease [Gardnerella leopoldii]|uniref:RNase J family beta-CASP ribonuclease n=1 Tax=Gardnerella leopoldii TaxID=2792978 RepID=UPI00157408E3|nr:ribonuclease J [Gardnerella vaginalis]
MNMKIEYDERTEEILAEVVRDALQSDADNMRSLNNQESSASSKQIRQSVKKVNKKMSSDTSTKSVSTKDVKSAKTKSTKKAKFNKETKTENAKSSTRRTGNVLPPVVNDQREGALIAPPKYRKGSMRIVPLGGLGEIGRNMNVIEYNGHILLIDCGVLFPEEEQPGVDLILPDFHYIQDRLDKVEALVLTHGHEDHIGGVPYLLKMRPDIPLIGSKLTLAFVEAKCKEHHIDPELIRVEGRDKMKVGPFNLEFITVTHSIPDALAVCVKTPAGTLIDTGDIKLDQLPLDHRITDLVEFGRLGEQGIDLLMADSTNAEVPGFVKPETSIGPALDRAFAEATRKIIVASFSSHVHRVQQVVDAAHKFGRKVVFVGRSMVRNMSIAADLGYLHIPENTVVDLKQAKDIQDDKLVYMCTGSQGEPMAALGRIADGSHRDITVNEFDTVILASSLIPGNEHEVYKVINKLVQLGARVINKDNAAIHVSGHCNEGELLYLYNIVKPKCAMPIHGEHRHLVANGLIAVKTGVDPNNVVLAEDGDVVDLYHGNAAVVGSVPCGYVYVDGDSVGELTDEELEKRRILGTEGFVSSFVVVDTEHADVVSGPKIFLNAVAEDETDFEKVRHQIVEQLQDAMMRGEHDTYKLQQIMRRTLGSWVARALRRKPMLVPVVADIAKNSQE